jgi:hypothetical protein
MPTLQRFAAVFHAAASNHFAVVIHLRTQRMDYGAIDTRRFIEKVLPSAGNTPVQIAHAAGWSGIDAATLSALSAFADAMADNPERFRHVWFDLSDMWQPYLDVIRQNCSQALHILDRFHIVAKMNKALDEVRAAESRQMAC